MGVVMHPIISSIQKIALYETKPWLYVIASNNSQNKFRLLKIGRQDPRELTVIDSKSEYSQNQIRELINIRIETGNRGRSGGTLRPDVSAFGIVGFVRFMEGYYLILVTSRRRVAVIGLHTIYKVQDTAMIYIPHESVRIAHPDEARYLKMFQSIDLSSNFYFSYDITHTLQVNMAIPQNIGHLSNSSQHAQTPACTRKLVTACHRDNIIKWINCDTNDPGFVHLTGVLSVSVNLPPLGPIETAETDDLFSSSHSECNNCKAEMANKISSESKASQLIHYGVISEPNRRFVWNSYLLSKVEKELHHDWMLYIMHGFISQSNVNIFGRSIYIAIIARRSNKYAGTRFLKRGSNFEGDVANEVETEQLVEDIGVSSTENPRMSSFVQMRGSIPAHWSQDISKMVPKPAITFDLSDAFAETAGAHFNKLLQRYGSPIIILNLVKEREKKKHESQLSGEYLSAITYLNQFLPPDHVIQYVHFDMARMNKGKGANVMGGLADIARSAVTKTGFYTSYKPFSSYHHSTVVGRETSDGHERVQTGIIRVNCVDCLDRTNTAQFALGKCALGFQLCSMGLLRWPTLDFDSDCVRLLEVLYEDHGDTLALQYGGSQLVHRIKTYRKTAPWTSQGNDIMQTLSRYYSNTFSDTEKQHAMNLFLGLFVPNEHSSPIWELVTDYYLHNSLMLSLEQQKMTPKTQWWDQEVMDCLPLSLAQCGKTCKFITRVFPSDIEFVDAYSDFHRPYELSELGETYANKISHSVRDFMPHFVSDYSPFTVRVRPGRRREETARGAIMGKNPSLTGRSSTSSTASTSSEESDEEDTPPHHLESHHSSPIRDVTSLGLVTFDSLFPSFQQVYGQELQSPSKADMFLYKRTANQSQLVDQPLSSGGMTKLVSPSSTLSDDSAFQVRPPSVSEHSTAVYSEYVARASGEIPVSPDKYKAYVNCQLGIFPVVGWE